MKRTFLIAACVSGLILGGVAAAHEGGHGQGTDPHKAEAAHKAMKGGGKGRYLVIASHTAEQCLKALDNMEAVKVMDKFEFGCMAGDHTGYAIVPAAGMEAALAMVPEGDRSQARAIKLSKFTSAQLKEFHAKMQ